MIIVGMILVVLLVLPWMIRVEQIESNVNDGPDIGSEDASKGSSGWKPVSTE